MKLEDRHLYEIIRDRFPCRLYFDLEFSTQDNPLVNGSELTKAWIELTLWKIHEYFGIALDYRSVVDLDSSTSVKFSRHVTIVIRELSGSVGSGSSSSSSVHRDEEQQAEVLFADNREVGSFVLSVVQDLLESTGTASGNPRSPLHLSIPIPHHAQPT